MKVSVRADASTKLGTGHIMRCLTLAEGFADDIDVTFLCRQTPGHLGEKIIKMGHHAVLAELPKSLSESQEAMTWQKLSDEISGDLLIVDHYGLGAEFCRTMRTRFNKVMVIDDLADRQHDCDILLDQNLVKHQERRYQGLIPAHCTALLGPEFALLRKEFSQQKSKRVSNHLLIGFGGSDEPNLTLECVKLWPQFASSGLTADIVVGASYPYAHELEERVREIDSLTLHQNCDYIATLMQRATLMLGSGGTSHWERCISGLPGLIITTADNQNDTTACLANKGACDWLCSYPKFDPAVLVEKVEFYMRHPDVLSQMSERAMSIIPRGSGVSKVITALEQLIRE